MAGIVPLYRELRKSLVQQRNKIARLQLLGRIEDYLTKEFADLMMRRNFLPLINIGKREEARRIDVAVLQGDLSKAFDRASIKASLRIRGFIELKYIRNRHRFGYSSAGDEAGSTLQSLARQLRRLDCKQYAGYPVDLFGRLGDTYGLVFVSYVRRAHEDDNKSTFLASVQNHARRARFCTHNFKAPKLSEIYSDCPVTVLRGRFMASLYIGLWRQQREA